MSKTKEFNIDKFQTSLVKIYVIAALVELVLDRFFYRVGTSFRLGNFYYVLEGIGDFFRYFMVLLNFTVLFIIVFNRINSIKITSLILFQTGIFLTYYIMTQLGYNISVEFDAAGLILTLVVIEILLTIAMLNVEIYKTFYRIIVISLQVILGLALIYKIAFTFNAKYSLNLEPFIILRLISEILSIVVLCWITFVFPLYIMKKNDKVDFKTIFSQKRQYVPYIIIIIIIAMMLGLINSGIEIVTEEHVWTFFDIYAWTVIFVLGFSTVYISAFFANLAILSLMVILIGILLIRKIGNITEDIVLNRLFYGITVLFCGSFIFLEDLDIYFLVITFIGITLITLPFLKKRI